MITVQASLGAKGRRASQRRPIAPNSVFRLIRPLDLTAYDALLWFLGGKRTLDQSPLKA